MKPKFSLHFTVLILLFFLISSCNTKPGSSAVGDLAETSIDGEKFPDGGGFKGRFNDRVFYIEVKEAGVEGFVRYKSSGKEHKISGKKTSPFDFQCEEFSTDELPIAKIRGKINNKELGADMEYSIKNSSESFRFQVDR
jgi:hypothetical protein